MSQNLDELIEQAEKKWFERFVTGPKQLQWEELPPQIGDPAPDVEVQDTSGRLRRLSEFWADGPALVLFLRHLGCPVTKERAVLRLGDEYELYEEAGATVAIVFEADPERAAAYADEYDIECPVICGPDGVVHETYGLLDFALPQAWYIMPSESIKRYRTNPEAFAQEFSEDEEYGVDGRPKVDHPWQQPGEFVVDQNGILQLTYRYQYAEDYPDRRVLTTAIRKAAQ